MSSNGITPLDPAVDVDSSDQGVHSSKGAGLPRFLLLRICLARVFVAVIAAATEPVQILATKQLACRSIQHREGLELGGKHTAVSCQDNPQVERLLAEWGTVGWIASLLAAGIIYPLWTLNITRVGRKRVMLLGFFTTAINIALQAFEVHLSQWSSLQHSTWRNTDIGLLLWRFSIARDVLDSLAGGVQNVTNAATIATMAVLPQEDRAVNLNILEATVTIGAVFGALLTSALPVPRSVAETAHLDTVGPIAWIVAAFVSLAGFLYVLAFIPAASLDAAPEPRSDAQASVHELDPQRALAQVPECGPRHWTRNYAYRVKQILIHRPAHPAGSLNRPLRSFPVAKVLLCKLLAFNAMSASKYKTIVADYKFHWGARENARYNAFGQVSFLISLTAIAPLCIKMFRRLIRRRAEHRLRARRSARSDRNFSLGSTELDPPLAATDSREPLATGHGGEDGLAGPDDLAVSHTEDLSTAANWEPWLAFCAFWCQALAGLIAALAVYLVQPALFYVGTIVNTLGALYESTLRSYALKILQAPPCDRRGSRASGSAITLHSGLLAGDGESSEDVQREIVRDSEAASADVDAAPASEGTLRADPALPIPRASGSADASANPGSEPAHQSDIDAFTALEMFWWCVGSVITLAIDEAIYERTVESYPWAVFAWSAVQPLPAVVLILAL